jgi:hypothetical protein
MMVYDVQRDAMVEVTLAEARAGMMRYARSLGPGSAACGVREQRGLADDLAEQPACTELACPECHVPAGKSCEPWCIAGMAVAAS